MSLQVYESQKKDIDLKIIALLEKRLLVTGILSKKQKKLDKSEYSENVEEFTYKSNRLNKIALNAIFEKIIDSCKK